MANPASKQRKKCVAISCKTCFLIDLKLKYRAQNTRNQVFRAETEHEIRMLSTVIVYSNRAILKPVIY